MSPRRASAAAAALALAAALLAASGPGRAAEDHAPDARAGAAPAALQQAALDSIRYAVRITDNNLHAITVTNYGFTGNNFINRSPSWEYPGGSGYEHVVRAGLWVGAHAVDDSGAFVGVSAAAVDGSQGTASQSVSEYTPAGLEVKERSSLITSQFYDPKAISEQDLRSEFSDRPGRTTLNNFEPHRPLNILVRQENYSWSFSDLAHFVIFHYTIRNIGLYRLTDAWVGLYSELASGGKQFYSCWPPSSSCSVVGGWFSKKWLEYDDSLHLEREHYCLNQPVPGACNLGLVPYWVGVKVLGVRPGNVNDTTDKKVTFYASNYAPSQPPLDIQRYAYMTTGQATCTDCDPGLQPASGDPVELLAVGPFHEIDPGDSVQVDFAFVGGSEIPDLWKHARSAQRAFDNHYVVPIPPPSPRDTVVARDGEIEIYWDDSPESSVDPTSPNPHDFEGYRVYLGEDRQNLRMVAQYDVAGDTSSFNTGLQGALRAPADTVTDGVAFRFRYHRRITGLRNGFKYFTAVTSFDTGTPEIEPLESGISQNKKMAVPGPSDAQRTQRRAGPVVFPNPYRVEARWDQGALVRDHYVWFTNLPQRCRLRIYTLSGDVVHSVEFDGRSYHGSDARGVYDPRRETDLKNAPTLSGTSYAWNLITDQGQAAATGLYLWAVEDKANGTRSVGKLLIVKSDRESF